jgi:hypothetical protein
MVTSMLHEDFYTSGVYSVPELGVYAGWVAHQGSFSASQPFVNETGDVVYLFTGVWLVVPQLLGPRNGHKVAVNAATFVVSMFEEEGDRFLKS